MGKNALIIFSFFICSLAQAQYQQLAGVFVPPDSAAKKNTLLLKFSKTNSLIDDQKFQFLSLRLGVEYDKRFRYGVSFSFLADSFFVSEDIPENAAYNRINYFGIGGFWEFMVINNYRWEFSVPLKFGYGGFNYTYLDSAYQEINQEKDESYMLFLEIGAELQYNINNWLGLGVGVGVRSVAAGDQTIIKYTRGPYYSFGLRYSIGGFYNSVFHRKQVLENKEKYFEARRKAIEQRRKKP